MARTFETQVPLPDGRHLDWRLMARVEKELKNRLHRWQSPGQRDMHGYSITVAFKNGKLDADSVADARRHVLDEPDEVEYVSLVAWAQPDPVRRCFVFLYPETGGDVLRPQNRSRVDVEGTERTEVYGLAEVIRQYTEAPPGDLPDDEPPVPPPAVYTGVLPPADSLHLYDDTGTGGRSRPATPKTEPPWWREHLMHLFVGLVVAVAAAIAGALANGLFAVPTP